MALDVVNPADLLIGRGEVYADRLDASRARTGERFIGNCTVFSTTIEDEVRDKYSSAEATAPLIKSVNVRRTPSMSIAMNEVNQENLELLFMGTKTNFAQTGATKSNYVPPAARVKKGYWFPVEDPAGTARRSISAVTVTGPSASPTYVVDVDYKLDTTRGRIYVIPGGAIADAAALEVDFTYATITGTTLPYVQLGVSNVIEAYIRVIGKPATGPTLEGEYWIVSIAPDGEFSFIGDDYAEFRLAGKVLADTVNHPTEPFGRVFEVAA